MFYVVDAGIAVKWFIPEEDSRTARQLLDRYRLGSDDLVAPELIVSEVANVLWKRSRRNDISTDEAANSLTDFLALGIPLASTDSIVTAAFSLAIYHNLTVYDALYLALSLNRGCDLITADMRFFNTVSPTIPSVKLLRDWQPPSLDE